MELQELYHLIGLQPEVIGQLEYAAREIPWEQTAPYLERLLDRETAPAAYRELNALLYDDPGHFKLLFCYLECARRAYDRYQDRHIPDQIYADTMRCFPRFLRECGQMYFDRGWWSWRQTSLSLFRIGALEYEFLPYENRPALALHIPSDAQLTPEAVDFSLAQAESFFHTCFPHYRSECYTCDSWLLSPRLRPLLNRNSNILAFQNRFCILRENREDREFIEHLFRHPWDTAYADLPAATSLQRQVKTLLLQGGTVGCAFGVLNPVTHPTL